MPSHEVTADLRTLRRLQRQHLLSIPFENLDIHWGQRIVLDTKAFYDKIVTGGRGGFCYELNGLFHELLLQVGFESRLVSASVYRDDGSLGPNCDHAAIIVNINGQNYLVDVGFGDFAAEPLRIAADEPQEIDGQSFGLEMTHDGRIKVSKRDGAHWIGQYSFSDTARDLSEFREMCDFHQDSPLSHFTQRRICSIMTENGRKTLTDGKFIVTSDGQKTETSFERENDFYNILKDEFRIGRPIPHL